MACCPGARLPPMPARQRGQAMAFVVITMAVVMLSGIFLFKAGRLTTEKMQLQNAADAVAFSISTLEARDLNFMSYLNRAMVANEIAVAQMVGLVSWAEHIRSVGDFLNWYNTTFLAGPTLGVSTAVIGPIASVFLAVGGGLKTGITAVAKPGIGFLSRVNGYFGYAQLAYHGVTVMLMISVFEELIPANAPGAKLSDFGTLSFIGHTLSYATKFTTTYNPKKAKYNEGFERFAAITAASRDPFSKSRSWGLEFLNESLCLNLFILKACLDIRISLDRGGGTELRFVRKGLGSNYNWSAADNVAFNLDLGVRIDFPNWMELLGADDFEIDLPAVGAPFSAGVAQAGKKILLQPDMLPDYLGGPLPKWAYGSDSTVSSNDVISAPNSMVPWMAVPPMPPGNMMKTPTVIVTRNYYGLPRYTDTTGYEGYGFEAPYLLVGLVKDIDDIEGASPRFKEPTGQFRMTDGSADSEIAAIAKSEVYFGRSTDLSYFQRDDGRTEYGSAFNPYWQARLVDTDFADRMVSLLIQQKQPWIPEVDPITLPLLPEPIDWL